MLTEEEKLQIRKQIGIPLEGISAARSASASKPTTKSALQMRDEFRAQQEEEKKKSIIPGASLPKPTMKGVADTLGGIFGGNKIGEAIGTEIAKARATDDEKQYIEDGPTTGEVLGDTGRVALNFLPFGKLSKSLAAAGEAAGLGAWAAKTVGNIGSGAIGGYGFDVAEGAKQGETGKEVLQPGMGTFTGGLIPGGIIALDSALKAAPNAGERVINSLIKPLLKDFSYGKNPGRVVSEEGIIANSFDELGKKIGQRRKEVGQQIGSIVDSPEASLMRDDLSGALKPIDDAIAELSKSPRTNKTAIQRLMDSKADILGEETSADGSYIVYSKKMDDLSPREMFDMKQEIADMTQFTGNHSDDKIVNKSLKQVYGNIKETLNKNLKEAGFDDIEKLNEKYADLSSAEIATKYREKINDRQNLLSFGSQISGGIGALSGFLSGSGATLGGLTGVVLNEASKTPAVKTRLAAILGKASPEGLSKLASEYPGFFGKIQQLYNEGSPGDYVMKGLKRK